ncbi:ChaN family lipoprotein [Vibrio rarus]|uniref:ChaN family lipoprotein n=1 Tax=Vibrio rarus TaxID=413403 RepID=UPI0021C2B1F3|nr:ChaN family lipoprotein [Vibrio rarus]
MPYFNTPLPVMIGLLSMPTVAIEAPLPINTFYDYQLYSPSSQYTPLNALSDELLSADVILVGEWHSHSAIHRFQSDFYQALLNANSRVTLSMEQFSRPAQPTINRYLEGKIGELAFIAHSNAWPNYTSDYRSLVEQAKSATMPVIAANASRDIVRCISKVGVDYLKTLDNTQQQHVATHLDTSDRPYKKQFMETMQGMDKNRVEHMYAAQIAWDETMAESIAMHIQQHPSHQVMHVAGKYHVANGMGIAHSLHKRAPKLKIVLITPVTKDFQVHGTSPYPEYTLLVRSLPPQVVNNNGSYGSHPSYSAHDIHCN